MSNSGEYYDDVVASKRDSYFASRVYSDGVTEVLLSEISNLIHEIRPKRILDLGTGNGYLIREVYRRNKSYLKDCELIGIDTSDAMLIKARSMNDKKIKYLKMDNNNISFTDGTFDLIIAKAVSNLSITEVFRLLRNNGWFLSKEYGHGKGILEITELLKIDNVDKGKEYWRQIKQLPFKYKEYREYLIKVERSVEDVLETLSIMRILPKNYERTTLKNDIGNYFGSSKTKMFSSDPYIIRLCK